jgi:hypothetical protein
MVRLEIIRRIWGGIAVFGLCAAFGLRLLYRGIRGDVLDSSGAPVAGRGWFVAGGIVLVLPLVGYLLFIWRQGYFAN